MTISLISPFSFSRVRRTRTLASLALIALAALNTLACSTKPPSSYYSMDYFESRADVMDRVVRSIAADKFGYSIKDWQVEEEGRAYSFTTENNYRSAVGAIQSRSGIRRRLWVEIRTVHVDDLSSTDRSRAQNAYDEEGNPIERNPELGNPSERAQVWLAVVREQNVDIRNPGAARDGEGDWIDGGADQQEAREILATIRFRMMRRKYDYKRLGDTHVPGYE